MVLGIVAQFEGIINVGIYVRTMTGKAFNILAQQSNRLLQLQTVMQDVQEAIEVQTDLYLDDKTMEKGMQLVSQGYPSTTGKVQAKARSAAASRSATGRLRSCA